MLDGAEVLVLPAAWVKGPLKEMRWELLTVPARWRTPAIWWRWGSAARAISATPGGESAGRSGGECGGSPALLLANLDPERVAYARRVLPVLENRRFARPELN